MLSIISVRGRYDDGFVMSSKINVYHNILIEF
jgi:hypothetical protein